MNTPKNTISNGLTGFWMRAGRDLSVRVVSGIMYKLPKGSVEDTHIHILSLPLRREIYVMALIKNGLPKRAEHPRKDQSPLLGATGFKVKWFVPVLANNTTLAMSELPKLRVDMSLNTYSNQPFSRLIGLRDGSAYATLRDFLNRRNAKRTQ